MSNEKYADALVQLRLPYRVHCCSHNPTGVRRGAQVKQVDGEQSAMSFVVEKGTGAGAAMKYVLLYLVAEALRCHA